MTGLFPEMPIAGPAPSGLGRMMAGGGGKVARHGNDFYPTPPGVTRALLAAERGALLDACDLHHAIWEPCGRGGAIAAELDAAGFATIATDLIADPAHRVTQQDLLTCRRALSPVAVTNPPFALAEEMIRHLLGDLQLSYVALLLKSTFWHAAQRTGLWRWRTPARIHALNWRPDFMELGAPTMEVIWTVWDASASGPCRYDILPPARGIDLLDSGSG